MANLLNVDILKQVTDVFTELKDDVQVLYFGKEEGCDYCGDTKQLVEEVTSLSDKIGMTVYDLEKDAEVAAQYNVDKVPGLVLAGNDGGTITDYGVRYAGIPSGHEFSSLVNDLMIVSGRDSGLEESTREFLKDLNEPVHLQVFVTPTCPYCPRAVITAHKMAMESPMVQAEMVEATEFPELSNKYGVSGVPDTSINHGKGKVVGAVPEANLVEEIKRALAS